MNGGQVDGCGEGQSMHRAQGTMGLNKPVPQALNIGAEGTSRNVHCTGDKCICLGDSVSQCERGDWLGGDEDLPHRDIRKMGFWGTYHALGPSVGIQKTK